MGNCLRPKVEFAHLVRLGYVPVNTVIGERTADLPLTTPGAAAGDILPLRWE
jgi:hypothetical protein